MFCHFQGEVPLLLGCFSTGKASHHVKSPTTLRLPGWRGHRQVFPLTVPAGSNHCRPPCQSTKGAQSSLALHTSPSSKGILLVTLVNARSSRTISQLSPTHILDGEDPGCSFKSLSLSGGVCYPTTDNQNENHTHTQIQQVFVAYVCVHKSLCNFIKCFFGDPYTVMLA